MIKIVRFVVDIQAAKPNEDGTPKEHGWTVTVQRGGTPVAGPRHMGRVTVGERHYPAPVRTLHDPGEAHDQLGDESDPAVVCSLHEAIRNRKGENVGKFGHYLFDALLGPETWAELLRLAKADGAGCLELAISCDDRHLNGLNWEMLSSDTAFLAAGAAGMRVAITRLVKTDPPVVHRQLGVPPRLLFVLGTTLVDPRIRPAAELLALARQFRGEGRTVNFRLIEEATRTKLGQEVKDFRPDVVHFICHGNFDGDEPYLILATDKDNPDPKTFASQLVPRLQQADGTFPAIVVLSACDTGQTRVSIAGPHQTAPMAAVLVKQGIPVVVGMGGQVADRTARLFTKQMGESIAAGEQLVKAVAEARMAPFSGGQNPGNSVDWGFPAVFLSDHVDPGYCPLPEDWDDANSTTTKWIRNLSGTFAATPVFCGRENFIRTFQSFFPELKGRTPDRLVLGAFVRSDSPSGYGRSRLLEELSIEALVAGHLPVLVPQQKEPPATLSGFADLLRRIILNLREEVLQLATEDVSQLQLLVEYVDGDPPPEGLSTKLSAAEIRSAGRITPKVLRRAVQDDLRDLVQAARTYPTPTGARRCAVVLLDAIEKYGVPVQEALFGSDPLFQRGAGLGSQDEPIPAVLTFAVGGNADALVRPIIDGTAVPPWLDAIELTGFQENGEDLLAYARVLLNPDPGSALHPLARTPWAFDEAETAREKIAYRYREAMPKARPFDMVQTLFYYVTAVNQDDGYLVSAEEDQTMLDAMRS